MQGRLPATTGESPRLPAPEQEAEWRAAQADHIYAAVFRYRFQDEFPDVLDEETFYLAVEQGDADDRLLELLSHEMPVVKKMSDWTDPPGTGKRMGLWGLTWRTNDEVTVEWATRTGKCIFSQKCRVVLGADGWEVADVRTTSAAMLARRGRTDSRPAGSPVTPRCGGRLPATSIRLPSPRASG